MTLNNFEDFKVMLCSTYKSSLVLIYVIRMQIGRFLFTGQTLSEKQSVSDNLKNIVTYDSYSLLIYLTSQQFKISKLFLCLQCLCCLLKSL